MYVRYRVCLPEPPPPPNLFVSTDLYLSSLASLGRMKIGSTLQRLLKQRKVKPDTVDRHCYHYSQNYSIHIHCFLPRTLICLSAKNGPFTDKRTTLILSSIWYFESFISHCRRPSNPKHKFTYNITYHTPKHS